MGCPAPDDAFALDSDQLDWMLFFEICRLRSAVCPAVFRQVLIEMQTAARFGRKSSIAEEASIARDVAFAWGSHCCVDWWGSGQLVKTREQRGFEGGGGVSLYDLSLCSLAEP